MPHLDEYPYDPRLPVSDVFKLEGLEKLRCVEDPGTRQRLFELYQRFCAPIVPKAPNPGHWEDR